MREVGCQSGRSCKKGIKIIIIHCRKFSKNNLKKIEENLVIKNVDKTIEVNAMWKESDTDKQIPSDITYISDLKMLHT